MFIYRVRNSCHVPKYWNTYFIEYNDSYVLHYIIVVRSTFYNRTSSQKVGQEDIAEGERVGTIMKN